MNNKKTILLFFLLLTSVAGFELYNLGVISLWHDEAFSALLVDYNFEEMIYRIGLDVHPPFYYIALRFWTALSGNSLFSLRLFSLFFGVLTILGTYLFTKEAFKNKKIALFSSLLVGLSSFQVQYNMEARMYTLGAFLIVISSYFLLKAIKSKKWIWWLLYALAVSAGIYSHYYVFFFVFAQGLYLAHHLFGESKFNLSSWLKNKNFQFGFGAYGLVLISYLPWLNIFSKQISQVQENYWIPQMNIWSVPGTFFKMTTGAGIDSSRFWYILAVLMIIVIAVVIYSLLKIKSSAKWLVFLLLIIPFLFSILLSLKDSIYLDRYFIFSLPFYLTLIVGAILSIKNKRVQNILIALTILGSLIAIPVYWLNLDIGEKSGMAGAASFLNQEVKQSDKIYVGSSFIYFTFKYYNQTSINPLLYAPNELSHFSGTALLSPKDIIKDFSKGAEKQDIIWMINTTGFGNYQPETPNNWEKLEEKGFEDVYGYRGWIVASKYKVQ